VVGRAVAGEAGKQQLLLDVEVAAALGAPELEELGGGLGRGLRGGAREPERGEQSVVVVA
jgi:hypothetical protein